MNSSMASLTNRSHHQAIRILASELQVKHRATSVREKWIRDLVELGMSREHAEQAAAIEVGKSNGDVLQADTQGDGDAPGGGVDCDRK